MAYTQGNISKRGLPYLKDKKARIYKATSGRDKYGNSINGYTPTTAADLWVYTRQLSQEQIFAARQYLTNETRVFVFNYHAGVTTADIVRYNGAWYDITRVDVPEDYKGGELFIYAKEHTQNIPANSIFPYSAN